MCAQQVVVLCGGQGDRELRGMNFISYLSKIEKARQTVQRQFHNFAVFFRFTYDVLVEFKLFVTLMTPGTLLVLSRFVISSHFRIQTFGGQ